MTKDVFADALAEPKKQIGASIPLFEKLIDEDPEADTEFPPKRYYNKFELIQSIQREVERILNTRRAGKKSQAEDLLTNDDVNNSLPEMFGLPDFSQYDATNSGDWIPICRVCERTIQKFEPRLTNVQVSIVGFNSLKQSLSINIQADLSLKEFQGEVTFPAVLSMY
jgi:type VI secretion system protein ImpF